MSLSFHSLHQGHIIFRVEIYRMCIVGIGCINIFTRTAITSPNEAQFI